MDRDLEKLALKFREAVLAALTECHVAGYDAMVHEAYRSQELQAEYYKRGRSVVPPSKPVTNAADNLHSWHGYGLAVDVISKEKLWSLPEPWWEAVANIFKKHGCKWGGDWRARDLPHMQWGTCKPSPSDEARRIFAKGGMHAVWKVVGAD